MLRYKTTKSSFKITRSDGYEDLIVMNDYINKLINVGPKFNKVHFSKRDCRGFQKISSFKEYLWYLEFGSMDGYYV